MNKVAVFFVSVFTMAFMACSSPDASKSEDKGSDEVLKVAQDALPDLRKPSEIALRLKAVGAVYLPGIGLDTSKVYDYLKNNNVAALNLGIYYADFVYSLIYKEYDAARMSVIGIDILAEGLGAKAEMNDALIKSFDDSINEEQRLLLLDEGLDKTRLKFRSGDNKKIAVLIVTGYYIEQLYEMLQIIANYPGDIEEAKRAEMLQYLYLTVSDQDVNLGNLIQHVNSVKVWAPAYKSFINDLERLQLAITEMKSAEELKGLSSAEIVSDKALIDVRRKVMKLRGFVTQ